MICLQVERQLQTEAGITKCQTAVLMDGVISIPIFRDSYSMDWEAHPYIVVAALTHEGNMSEGHYQCLLRTSCTPPEWALKNDTCPIAWTPSVPTWFAQQSQLIWLIPAMQWQQFEEDLQDSENEP